jgi:hypothetical protein
MKYIETQNLKARCTEKKGGKKSLPLSLIYLIMRNHVTKGTEYMNSNDINATPVTFIPLPGA